MLKSNERKSNRIKWNNKDERKQGKQKKWKVNEESMKKGKEDENRMKRRR
jgi:hypothetical protein